MLKYSCLRGFREGLARPSKGLGYLCADDECAVVQGGLIVSGSYLSASISLENVLSAVEDVSGTVKCIRSK